MRKSHADEATPPMSSMLFVVPEDMHNRLVIAAFMHRGFSKQESFDMARICADAARHGVRTHNAIKAIHLENHYGSRVGGCQPCANVVEVHNHFAAARIWNANRKLGPSVAYEAMEACMQLADKYGVGMVSVDNAWHYLWGGGYVLEAARKGYIAYTNCTAMLAEVVPFGGRTATLGTNPHSWAFPTADIIGFPILVDWATSSVSMGRVQQLKRENEPLPQRCAIDENGEETTDPAKAKALLPFGKHKGYGLAMIDEIIAAFIGASLPTLRGRFKKSKEKHSPAFFFQVIHPDAISANSYALNRNRSENIRAVLSDIIGHDNGDALLPGEVEAEHASVSAHYRGLLFTAAELDAFDQIAVQCNKAPWAREAFVGAKELKIKARK